jgi:hypothetical protein
VIVSGKMVQKRKVIILCSTRRTGCDYFLEHEIVCINEWLGDFFTPLIYPSLIDIFMRVVCDCFNMSVGVEAVQVPSHSHVGEWEASFARFRLCPIESKIKGSLGYCPIGCILRLLHRDSKLYCRGRPCQYIVSFVFCGNHLLQLHSVLVVS